jgi:hypothetical protein
MGRLEKVPLDVITRLLVAVEFGIWTGEQDLNVIRPRDRLLSECLAG